MESWRTSPLPPGWSAIRRRILERDGHRCRAIRRDETRCWDRATDVHHLNSADDHSDRNLVSLCSWHHDRITAKEANDARTKQGRTTERRPKRQHPGLV
jgi:5-methylcytosine-specific restriction protein A